MEKRSSTSSSNPPPLPSGFPWAFALAVLLVGLVELVVRQVPLPLLIPYAMGSLEYHGVADHLEVAGPAQVCVIGSSRAREAIVAPRVAKVYHDRLGRSVTVANYACAGARAAENESLIKYMLRQGKPEFILYGLSPRQLLERDAPRSQVVLFLDWQSWWRDYGENPSWSRAQIPALLRRQCGRWFRTLKYRHRVSAMANDLVQAFRLRRDRRFPLSDLLAGTAFACPQRGETSRWQSVLPDLSLATRPVSQEKVKSFADHLLVDGRYVMGGEQLRHMQRIVTLCRQAGVELVLLELPLNQALERALPPGVRDEFLTLVRNLARDRGVDFVERDETPLDLQDADFLDFSHLSFQGAKRFTQVVTEKVIVPRLRARPFGR